MKILLATHNVSKFKMYKDILSDIDINILSLSELDVKYDVEEDGKDVKSNAIKKAIEYSKMSGYVTMAVDDGLIFDNIPEDLQPNVNVRRVNDVRLTDEQALEYYSNLVKEYGNDGKLNGKWIKCIAIAKQDDVEYLEFYKEKIFVDKIHSKRNEGYPLDSMSIDTILQKYTVEITKEEYEIANNLQTTKIREFVLNSLRILR